MDPDESTQSTCTLAVMIAVPWARAVDWQMLAPGQFVARVRLRWWAWFAFGALHTVALRRAQEAIARNKPADVAVLVALW